MAIVLPRFEINRQQLIKKLFVYGMFTRINYFKLASGAKNIGNGFGVLCYFINRAAFNPGIIQTSNIYFYASFVSIFRANLNLILNLRTTH